MILVITFIFKAFQIYISLSPVALLKKSYEPFLTFFETHTRRRLTVLHPTLSIKKSFLAKYVQNYDVEK